ncbi:hypothetical protein OROGR_028005 [Orobanche gracilis]
MVHESLDLVGMTASFGKLPVLCKFFAHGACLKGEHCEYSHEWKAPPNNICTFYQNGICAYGSRCRYDHIKVPRLQSPSLSSSGDISSTEDPPSGTTTCCAGIITDVSPEYPVSSGLFYAPSGSVWEENLGHRDNNLQDGNWRSSSPASGVDASSALRACPICRKLSYFVIPSVIWYFSKEEKQAIVDSYKAKLRSIDCKHFDFGNGTCPFGTSCFYKTSINGRHLIRGGPGPDMTYYLSTRYATCPLGSV